MPHDFLGINRWGSFDIDMWQEGKRTAGWRTDNLSRAVHSSQLSAKKLCKPLVS
jgi:hypothetical protein